MVKKALSKLNGKNASEEEFLLSESGNETANWFDEGEEASLEGQLAVDMYQTERDIVVKAPVAGVDESDIEIEVGPDQVAIRGERKEEREVSEGNYHARECFWGAFSRAVALPVEGDPEKARATFKSGILTIRIPKAHRHNSVKLKVNE